MNIKTSIILIVLAIVAGVVAYEYYSFASVRNLDVSLERVYITDITLKGIGGNAAIVFSNPNLVTTNVGNISVQIIANDIPIISTNLPGFRLRPGEHATHTAAFELHYETIGAALITSILSQRVSIYASGTYTITLPFDIEHTFTFYVPLTKNT